MTQGRRGRPAKANLCASLRGFYREAADALLAAFPAWQDNLSLVMSAAGTWARFVIPDPVTGRGKDLMVTTENEEIIAYFAGAHAHLSLWSNPPFDFDHEIAFLQNFLEERWVVYAQIGPGSAYTGSGGGFALPMSEQTRQWLSGVLPLEFRSWRGTYDGPNPPTENSR